VGVAYIALLWPWLAGWQRQLRAPVSQMSAAGACISVTHQFPKIMSATIGWDYAVIEREKMYPVETVLCSRGLLRKSTFPNTRAKSGKLLLPHNKILLALFLTFSPSLLCWVLERNAWCGFISLIFLSSQIRDPHFFFLFAIR